MGEDDLVDISEASRITGLKVPTLYKVARQGKIRSFKVLTTLRFRRGDLTALIRERATGTEK